MSDNQQHLIELNLSEYTFLLNNPNAVNEKQAKALETVVESFPYFQSARALYLKGLYNQDSYKYNFALKQTVAHTADRSVLFDFITSDEFTIIEKDIYEKKLALLMDIDVVDSEIHHVEELVSEKTDEIDTPEITSISVKPTVEFESAEIDFVKLENNSILEEVKEEITVSEITPTLIEVEPIIEEEKIEPNPINLAENEVEETIISTENSEDLIEEATTKEVTSIDENSFESLSEEVIPEIKKNWILENQLRFLKMKNTPFKSGYNWQVLNLLNELK
ncbi:hypothetical protein [Flavobacterium piscinae]|uniref:hypothetical protein n=1 Tax=Flavobacterium piscinae TaxID=2506424 RepID=UPI002AABFB28|nr:hypothetical protein [Flavobacterium piscinae]